MHTEMIILRLIHVMGGVFWVGSGIFSTYFLIPAIAPGSPAFGEVFAGLARRRFFTITPIAAMLTMLTGARLLWIVSGGFADGYFATTRGIAYGLGAIATVVGFTLAMFVSRPSGQKAAQLAMQRPQAKSDQERAAIDATMARLRVRGAAATAVAMALLLVAACAMAVARYL